MVIQLASLLLGLPGIQALLGLPAGRRVVGRFEAGHVAAGGETLLLIVLLCFGGRAEGLVAPNPPRKLVRSCYADARRCSNPSWAP